MVTNLATLNETRLVEFMTFKDESQRTRPANYELVRTVNYKRNVAKVKMRRNALRKLTTAEYFPGRPHVTAPDSYLWRE